MIYIFVLLLLLLLSFRYDINGMTKGRDESYLIVLIIFILIPGLRWRLGTDTVSYINNFYHYYPYLSDFSFKFLALGKDPLFALINSIVKSLGGGFYWVQLIEASIVNVLVFKYIKKHSQYIFTCVLFYYFISFINYNMEVMRGSISIVICLFGNDYIKERKWIKGYFLYFIALMFHSQTILLFIMPLFFFVKLNKIGIAFLFGAFLFGFVLKQLLNDYLFLLEDVDTIENKVDTYSNSERFSEQYPIIQILELMFIKVMYPIVSLLYIRRFWNIDKQKELVTFILFCCAFALIQVNFPIAMRYVYYYEVYIAILYSESFVNLLKNIPKLSISILYVRSIIVFFPVFLYFGYQRYSTRKYHPYSTVIEQSLDKDREKRFKMRESHYFYPRKNEY